MSPDIHTLTGAYAADALPDDERRMFERHLAACDACAREVAELRATTGRLAAATTTPPPAALKDAVMAEVRTTRQEAPMVAPPSARSRSRLRRLAPVAAAAALVAVVALSVTAIRLNDRLDDAEATAQQLADALASDDARVLTAPGPGGSRTAAVVAGSEALFVASDLPDVPDGRTYEVWLLGDGSASPAGLFRPGADGRVTHAVLGDASDAQAIGVTVEPAGGSAQPTSDPLVVLPIGRP